jgi:hypothetical protein
VAIIRGFATHLPQVFLSKFNQLTKKMISFPVKRKTQEQSPVKHNVIYRQAGIRAQFRGGDTFKLG